MDNKVALILGKRYRELTRDIDVRRQQIADAEQVVIDLVAAKNELVGFHEAIETDMRVAGKAEYLEGEKR